MSTSPPRALELPSTAPRVRITAGAGTASQKTWNLRRPVTLIGSRRPAHIVLHDKEICPAHCVIINTGIHILIKDLHTTSGIIRNKERITVSILEDGDVIQVGTNRIQVAIQETRGQAGKQDDAAEEDPFVLPEPVLVSLVHADTTWSVTDALTLIGTHEDAPIRLDHEEVSKRHALLFQFGRRLAIFDLVGHDGVTVNGLPAPVGFLNDGDGVHIGPLLLQIGAKKEDLAPLPTVETDQAGDFLDGADPVEGVERFDEKLEVLEGTIADSWNKLNQWQSQLFENANSLSQQEIDLTERELEVDARDAAMRGQLHDVARLQEQLAVRENELQAQQAKIAAEEMRLQELRESFNGLEMELKQRGDELSRRERAFAQRWMKLQSTKCPHCGLSLKTAGPQESVNGMV